MKIFVVSKNGPQLADISRILRERNRADEVNTISGTLDKLDGMTELEPPDILLLDQPTVEMNDLELIERLGQQFPQLAFIVMCQQQTPEFLIQAMRAGVREVLPAPVSASLLCLAISRIEEKRDKRTQTYGKVLAFVSCKGGSGATFIVTNLGYALAMENKRVALIDLNLQFGDASLFISDQKPVTTLSDVCQQIHRLDPSFLASSMLNVLDNFSVLAAPDDPIHASDIKPEHIDAILKLARRQYDFVVLDVGHSLDAVSIRALDQADMIFPVLQITLPYIRDGKRLLGVFRSLDYRKEKIQLIVNRHERHGEIKLNDLETACSASVYKTIPNHYEAAAASVNQGVPILKLEINNPISRSLQEFARTLAGVTTTQPESWLSQAWFSRVLQRA